ncbi:MAG: patatin-like phospholipase family protein [Ectothiorhodospiraceae bacterium]|nr:patatin-like phospholipase family protein [Ectothiorhodospiraceae bacterium]
MTGSPQGQGWRSVLRRWADRLGRRRGSGTSRRLTLALQGGGSHGAFTWGVLDRLLEEGHEPEGISGASAGAMNAAALASGWQRGGADGARESLQALWHTVSAQSVLNPIRSTPLEQLFHGWNRDLNPGYLLFSGLSRMTSPYQFNPTGYNPLIPILERSLDFEALRHPRAPRLFISLTNVHTGELELRSNPEITPAVLAASACLPLLFHAVELNGQHYWDGGYTGNPALYPLVFECRAPDLLLIQLTPPHLGDVPHKANDIINRAAEISFHANVMRELHLLDLLARRNRLGRSLRLHRIDTEGVTRDLGNASRLNTDWEFLTHLRDRGRERAEAWLRHHV